MYLSLAHVLAIHELLCRFLPDLHAIVDLERVALRVWQRRPDKVGRHGRLVPWRGRGQAGALLSDYGAPIERVRRKDYVGDDAVVVFERAALEVDFAHCRAVFFVSSPPHPPAGP